MLKIEQKQLKANLDNKFCQRLAGELAGDFELLLYGMRQEFLERLNLEIDREDSFVRDKIIPSGSILSGGDLVYLKPDSILYYKVPDFYDYIEVGIIGNTGRIEFEQLCNRIIELVREHSPEGDLQWEPVKELAVSFRMLMENARTIVPGKDDISAARELENTGVRQLLQTIMDKDSIFLADLKKIAGIENIDEIIKSFQELGLVSGDYSLLCTKTGQQVLKVSDRSALEDLANKGFKCFVCGASIGDEKVERTVSCTPFGKRILSDDYWFLVSILNSLESLGFSYNDVYLSREESQKNALFLNVNNEALMIYLANRKLNLDDAYLINAQVAAYQLRHLILISSTPISILMKKHIQEANPGCGFSFIEGMDHISSEIKKILLEKEELRVMGILEDMNDLTPVPVEDMVMKKIIPKGIKKPLTGLEEVEERIEKTRRSSRKKETGTPEPRSPETSELISPGEGLDQQEIVELDNELESLQGLEGSGTGGRDRKKR